jgi:hypothetical protein
MTSQLRRILHTFVCVFKIVKPQRPSLPFCQVFIFCIANPYGIAFAPTVVRKLGDAALVKI